MANRLREFLDAGPERTNRLYSFLDRTIAAPLNYYLGPTGVPKKANSALRLGEYSDAGDMQQYQNAGTGFFRSPSLGSAVDYATAGAALAVPFVGGKMIADGVDVVGDAVRSGADDARRFVADQDGVLPTSFDEFLKASDRGKMRKARNNAEVFDGLRKGDIRASEINITGDDTMRYEMGELIPEDLGSLAVVDDMMGGVYVGQTPKDIDLLKNANSPIDYGRAYGYSDDDIAKFYMQRAGGNPDVGFADFMRDAPTLNPAQAEAQNVLDLLKSGRADEVTDDMLAAADDMYLFENYDLPMDEASRTARLDENWPTDGYHSTRADYDSFDKGDIGYHIGTEEQATERLKDTRGVSGIDGERILPVRYAAQNPLEMRDVGQWDNSAAVADEFSRINVSGADEIYGEADDLQRQFVDFDDWTDSYENRGLLDELRSGLESDGYDSIKYRNQVENAYGGEPGMTRDAKAKYNVLNKEWHELRKSEALRAAEANPAPDPSTATPADIDAWLNKKIEPVDNAAANRMAELRTQMDEIQRTGMNDPYSTIVLDPANIRSRFARADPRLKHLRNLSAGVGGLGLVSNEENRLAIRNYLEGL